MRRAALFVAAALCTWTGCRDTSIPGHPVVAAPATPAAAPPAPGPDAPSGRAGVPSPPQAREDADVCARAHANVLRIERERKAPLQTVGRMERDRAVFLQRCKREPAAVIECLAGAADARALSKCASLRDGSDPQDAEHTVLCSRAYDNAVRLMEESGAPPSAVQQMRDRRAPALRECAREPESVARCLAEARDMEALRTCREVDAEQARPADPALRGPCMAARAHMLEVVGPGDAPPEVLARMQSDEERFMQSCLRQPPATVECMLGAVSLKELRACAGER